MFYIPCPRVRLISFGRSCNSSSMFVCTELPIRFIVAFNFVVRYDAQSQVGFFVGVLVGARELSLVVAWLITFLQPLLTLVVVDRLGRFLSAIDARGSAVVDQVQSFGACRLVSDVLQGVYPLRWRCDCLLKG